MDEVRAHRPWVTEAIVLLPDHWHALWRLPENDADYSARVCQIKRIFTRTWLASGGKEAEVSSAKKNARRRGVWQRSFWEHIVKDAADFKLHMDYIHLNPVKHDLAERPAAWPWSSFRQWVAKDEYQEDWLGRVDLPEAVEYFWHDQ